MVNIELLKTMSANFKISPATATEFHKQLFSVAPETALLFDAEDLNPESLHKSRKFVSIGAGIIHTFLELPGAYESKGSWNGAVKNLIEIHSEHNVPFAEFKKSPAAVCKMFESVGGGCSAEQTEAWHQLFEELFKSMNEMGYK